ncbi:hypothetical protein KC722_03375, partial [Candidatus Kaiserbacteria bacterium]|nr:hypothetical protein [Candidatus Kaiserbacteria bacterium]
MNTKLTALLVGVIVVGLVGYIWLRPAAPASAPSTDADSMEAESSASQQTADTKDNVPLSGFGSFMSLMGLGKNLTCEFSSVADETGGAVAGTVYISGERLRGDFEMEQAGTVMESHMIQDGEYSYTWSESAEGTFALKMKTDDSTYEATPAGGDSVPARQMTPDQDVRYDC